MLLRLRLRSMKEFGPPVPSAGMTHQITRPAWPWADIAGACHDSSDDSIWLANQYATTRTANTSPNGNFGIWVARVAL